MRLTAAKGVGATRRIASAEALDPDAGLVATCRQGDRAACERLLERHRKRIVNLAYQMLGSADEAQDAAQEAFVRALTHLKGFRGDATFGTWLRRITVNECLNRLARRGRETDLSETAAADSADTDDALAVRAAVQALSPPLRAVVVLRELHGASYEEIARILDIPIGTVRSRLAAARDKLRELLTEDE